MKYASGTWEARLLEADPEAIGTVSRWIATTVARHGYWSLRAEWPDLHQEAMSGVLAGLREGRFDAARDFQAYVAAIARFTVWRAMRRRRLMPETPLAAAALPQRTASAETEVLRSLVLQSAIGQASRPCRDLIRAFYFEQRSYDEIAAALGVPVGTVKSRLFRCLDGVRRALPETDRQSLPRRGTAKASAATTLRRPRTIGDETA